MDIDPDKIIAAILTGIVVKVGEKGFTYLKSVWKARRARKLASKKTLTLTGSQEKPYFASSPLKKALSATEQIFSFIPFLKNLPKAVMTEPFKKNSVAHVASVNHMRYANLAHPSLV